MPTSMRSRHRPRSGAGAVIATIGILVAVLVLALVLSRSLTGAPSEHAESPPQFSPNPVSSPALDPAGALELLAALPGVDGASGSGYERDRFGPRWADIDRNGCDTRNDILGRDLAATRFRDGTGGCTVIAGQLTDPYDGHVESFASGEQTSPLVQIDHIVALAWAWRHGADAWSDADRLRFANDPHNLVATADENNAAKSDAGPGEWLPARAASACGFVIAWVAVVDAYGLGIGVDDRDAARDVLEGC